MGFNLTLRGLGKKAKPSKEQKDKPSQKTTTDPPDPTQSAKTPWSSFKAMNAKPLNMRHNTSSTERRRLQKKAWKAEAGRTKGEKVRVSDAVTLMERKPHQPVNGKVSHLSVDWVDSADRNEGQKRASGSTSNRAPYSIPRKPLPSSSLFSGHVGPSVNTASTAASSSANTSNPASPSTIVVTSALPAAGSSLVANLSVDAAVADAYIERTEPKAQFVEKKDRKVSGDSGYLSQEARTLTATDLPAGEQLLEEENDTLNRTDTEAPSNALGISVITQFSIDANDDGGEIKTPPQTEIFQAFLKSRAYSRPHADINFYALKEYDGSSTSTNDGSERCTSAGLFRGIPGIRSGNRNAVDESSGNSSNSDTSSALNREFAGIGSRNQNAADKDSSSGSEDVEESVPFSAVSQGRVLTSNWNDGVAKKDSHLRSTEVATVSWLCSLNFVLLISCFFLVKKAVPKAANETVSSAREDDEESVFLDANNDVGEESSNLTFSELTATSSLHSPSANSLTSLFNEYVLGSAKANCNVVKGPSNLTSSEPAMLSSRRSSDCAFDGSLGLLLHEPSTYRSAKLRGANNSFTPNATENGVEQEEVNASGINISSSHRSSQFVSIDSLALLFNSPIPKPSAEPPVTNTTSDPSITDHGSEEKQNLPRIALSRIPILTTRSPPNPVTKTTQAPKTLSPTRIPIPISRPPKPATEIEENMNSLHTNQSSAISISRPPLGNTTRIPQMTSGKLPSCITSRRPSNSAEIVRAEPTLHKLSARTNELASDTMDDYTDSSGLLRSCASGHANECADVSEKGGSSVISDGEDEVEIIGCDPGFSETKSKKISSEALSAAEQREKFAWRGIGGRKIKPVRKKRVLSKQMEMEMKL
ncbi:hypothetical protein K432DRAFT_421582 [Lepidopterella palustris CBS 459.81]|uniref:Uncharacterized protein n=1 Tax=Lepidopterella palustris CBS 459.81 TaxID=1314670 RepID=A0A8E2EKJ9_9PEZI|nr:hypothetical protein K432DRAFT_421582 [Lepidopterella palustris CBS 459.81]